MGKELTRSDLAAMLGVDEADLDEAIAAQKAEMDRLMNSIVGDEVECSTCGSQTPIQWATDRLSWSVECRCGWSAAGSGPPHRKN